MELKRLDPEKYQAKRDSSAKIRFTKPSRVALSGKLSKMLNLKPGREVLILQDEHRPEDYYLSVVKHKDQGTGFELQDDNASKHGLKFHSNKLVKRMLNEFKPESTSVGFRVSSNYSRVNGVRYYCLITKNPY